MAKTPKTQFQPMLAAKIETTRGVERMELDFSKVQFPVFCTPKIDGVRALVRPTAIEDAEADLVSRKNILIPNHHTQQRFNKRALLNIDGELAVGRPNDENLMQQTTSGCMSRSGTPDVDFWVFDIVPSDLRMPFAERLAMLRSTVDQARHPNVHVIEHTLVSCRDELEHLELQYLDAGYEGLMIRSPMSPYKFGRSTLNEGYLIKLKRFHDGEAVILEVYEQMENTNEAEEDHFGHTKRSSAKAGKIPKGTLGGFVVRDLETGHVFRVGGGKGLTIEERARLWAIKDQLPGQLLKHQSFKRGVKDLPRFPGYLGIRHPNDM